MYRGRGGVLHFQMRRKGRGAPPPAPPGNFFSAKKFPKRRLETCESPLAALPLTDLHAYTVLRRQSRQELVVKVSKDFLSGRLRGESTVYDAAAIVAADL